MNELKEIILRNWPSVAIAFIVSTLIIMYAAMMASVIYWLQKCFIS